MARTVEESVMNAIMGAFVGNGQAQVSKPSKSYMAIGDSIPKVGEHYKCKKLEKNSKGELTFRSTETTTVQDVKNLAGNVFIVSTRNSYYVTRVLYEKFNKGLQKTWANPLGVLCINTPAIIANPLNNCTFLLCNSVNS